MAVFWLEWELWMKLVFLLACGIAATVTTALLKVAFLRHKYSKLVIEDKEVAPHEYTEAGYLFGAPALERGYVVEGIWTPHSNTPESSRETLHHSSSQLVLMDARRDVSALCIASRTATSNHHLDQQSCRAVVVDHSDPSIPQSHTDKDSEESELPSSGLLLSTMSYSLFMLQHPDFAQAMQDIENEYQAADPSEFKPTLIGITPSNAAAKESEHRSSSPHLCLRRASHTAVSCNADSNSTSPLAYRYSTDLSMLDRQRHKLAAETGQFVQRRGRK